MVLYHVTFELDEPLEKTFRPRVPSWLLNYDNTYGENDSIPRICFAPSVKLALQAINCCDELAKGRPFIVYEFFVDENDENLIHPQELYEKGYVIDALENKEYWYLDSVTLGGKVCMIDDFYAYEDYAWSVIKNTQILWIANNLMVKADEQYSPIIKSIIDSYEDKDFDSFDLYDDFQNISLPYYLMQEMDCYLSDIPWSHIYRLEDIKFHHMPDFRLSA